MSEEFSSFSSFPSLHAISDPVYVMRAAELMRAFSTTSAPVDLSRAYYLIDQIAFSPNLDSYVCFDQTVLLSDVLRAMVFYAKDCGGAVGQFWAVSRILACENIPGRGSLDMLRNVAIVWLTHFLFFFKLPDCCLGDRHDDDSPYDMILDPTLRERVLERDDYRCKISGMVDTDHVPNPTANSELPVNDSLDVCHILKRSVCHAIVSTQGSEGQPISKSAATTVDILGNYTAMSGLISQQIDLSRQSCNAFTVFPGLPVSFYNYTWFLKPTEVDNEYEIHMIGSPGPLIVLLSQSAVRETMKIRFTSHSQSGEDGGRSSEEGGQQITRSCMRADLPSRHLFEIHAAVAGILDMSGAGRFLHALLGGYAHCWNGPKICSWEDMIRAKETEFASARSSWEDCGPQTKN